MVPVSRLPLGELDGLGVHVVWVVIALLRQQLVMMRQTQWHHGTEHVTPNVITTRRIVR